MTTHINGTPADASALSPLVFAGFAHFTAMQVRDGRVRGLDLHLDRLRNSSEELFGAYVPDEKILGYLGAAVEAAGPDLSLSCYITPTSGEFSAPHTGTSPRLDVVIKASDPVTPSRQQISLDIVEHQRHLPHIKHVGEVAKTQYLWTAQRRGFDDAAFTDAAGRLSEATIWNLAFWDGDSVVWPQARVLPGVTMQILERQLRTMSVDQRHAPLLPEQIGTQDLAGVVMNSWTPAIPICRLGDIDLAGRHPEFARLLHDAYAAEVPVPLL